MSFNLNGLLPNILKLIDKQELFCSLDSVYLWLEKIGVKGSSI
tara:strand:+ start:312 stop:440 length:129 start_codon:yes stop_codon:yes gene_type:complete